MRISSSRKPSEKKDKPRDKPAAAPEAAHLYTLEDRIAVRPDQSRLYAKASLDDNPLHLDDHSARAAGLRGAVLQGLCTMAFCQRAIVNLASQAGRRGEALVSHYCASKAAVISYTQSAALAMAPHATWSSDRMPPRFKVPLLRRKVGAR